MALSQFVIMAKQSFQIFLAFVFLNAFVAKVHSENFITDADVTYGNANIHEDGNQLQLNMDIDSQGSEARSKQQYTYGRFDIQIKAVQGHSAGVVTSFFLLSPRPTNDEMDFELLGNITGEPLILHTNLWTNGLGDREQQIYLWFDPAADFHNYTFIWNPYNILWLVDEVPVRVFKNAQEQGIPFLTNQRLNSYAALWNGEEWATRKGQVKTNWTKAPFTAYYRNYNADACVMTSDGMTCSESRGQWWNWIWDESDAAKLKWVRENYLVYDYCQDSSRFPQGVPPECSINV